MDGQRVTATPNTIRKLHPNRDHAALTERGEPAREILQVFFAKGLGWSNSTGSGRRATRDRIYCSPSDACKRKFESMPEKLDFSGQVIHPYNQVWTTMFNKSETVGTLGEFEVLVLTAVLAAGQDAYGATIHEEIEGLVSGSRDVSLGSVYTTLDRLEQKGYLKSWTGAPTPERGGRAKRYYEVQATGQRALRAALGPMKKAWEIVQGGV